MPVPSGSRMLPMESGIVSFCLGSGHVTCFGHWNTLLCMRMGMVQTPYVSGAVARLLCFHCLPEEGLEPGSRTRELQLVLEQVMCGDLDPTLS